MPRMARKKTFDSIFHVMCRSVSEVDLFADEDDKVKYLGFIKKYQKLYEFRVYGYCLMDTHAHLIIDANGSDISKVMHSINFTYAQYFNRRHKRHGHLFQDRFKSKIVDNERYLFALSAYVHNNPTDIKEYKECPEQYRFSSLSIYLGLTSDPFELIDDGFVMSFFGKNAKEAREKYWKFVLEANDDAFKKEIEFSNEGSEYKSYRKILVRNMKPEKVVEYVSSKTQVNKLKLYAKYTRNVVEAKALIVILLRCLCNLKCSEICSILGNITNAGVSRLSSIGLKLIDEDERYRNVIKEFITAYAV